jgi:uncharacterized protein (DUF849 family)
MRSAKKIIVTCAVTGSIHTPTMSPALPITADDIAREAVEAAEAGAAIVHLHARDSKDGRPTAAADAFMAFLPRIKQQCDAVINTTTGGGPGMSIADRLEGPLRARPELASLNMGTMNFGAFGLAERPREWIHDWEKPFLEGTRSGFQSNTFTQIETIIRELGIGCGTRFEFECYDVGHLYTLAHFADAGLIKPPFLIQSIFGILGGGGADPENLLHMRATADRLFGDDYYLSAFAVGRDQMRFATLSALLGGNVRVGLEDSLHIGRGQLAAGNAEQVAKVVRIVHELGMEIASPDEARAMLELKGGDDVGF